MRFQVFCALLVGLSACSLSPTDTIVRVDRFLAEGKLDDAELLCRKLLVKKQLAAEANQRMARIAIRRGQRSAAFGFLQDAVSLNPRDEASWNLLGELMLPAFWEHPSRPADLRGRLETAASTLLRLNPNSAVAHRIQGYLALDHEHPVAAERAFRQVLSIQPPDTEAAAMLVQVLFERKRSAEAAELAARHLERTGGNALLRSVVYRGLLREGKAAEAGQLLIRESNRNPADSNAKLDLSMHYRRTGASGKADALIGEVESQAKTVPGTWMTLAAFHQSAGDYRRAASALMQGEKAEPAKAADYLRRLIEIQFESADLASARETANRACERFPGDEDFRTRKYLLNAELGGRAELEAATAHVRSRLEKQASSPIYRMHMGRLLLRGGDLGGANREFARAIQVEPGLIEARLLLMRGLIGAGDYPQALREADATLRIHATLAPALAYRMSALRALGRFAEARAVLRELRESGADPSAATLEEAYLLLMEGKPKAAEGKLDTLPAASRGGIRAVAARAEALTAQRRWPEAIASLRTGLSENPGHPLIVFALAKSLAADGQVDTARETFERLIESQPASGEALRGLAELEASRGDGKAAVAAYRRWIAVQPESLVALNDLAYLLAQQRTDLPEALAMAKKALQISPGNPAILDTVGVIHLQMGNAAEAAHVLGALSRQAPEIPAVRYHAGQSFHARGQRNAALEEWAAALRLQPAPELKREIEAAIASAKRQ